ncbi:SNPC4-like protein, partial [Mya arenaria]
MDVDHEDIDEDIEQLNKVLQDEDDEEGEESEGELRSMELDGESYTDRDGSRPSTSTDVTSSFPTTSICTDPDDMSVRFDSSTINAESCLAMNRAYQEVLLDTLRQIEMSLAENRTKQSKLQQEVKDASRSSNYEKKMAGKGKRCTEQNIPYFRDKDGFYPPANEDVKIKQTLKEDKTYVKAKPGWSKTQRQTLISAVKEDAIQQLVRPLLSKLEVESEKANKCKNKEEIDASKTRIQHLYDEMKGKYDATECEKMWRTVLQPGINKEKWSEDEDKKLEELVEKHNMRDWKAIAEELGTNRTPYQCLQHYQEEHFDYDQSPWTEAEDELLKEVVETCRYGSGVIPWPQVAYYIERRSTKMCEMRWSKVDPSLTHGRWTEAEDMKPLQRKILHPAFYIDKHNTIQLRNLPGFKKATPRTLISNTTKRRYKQTDEGAKNKQTDKGSKDLIGEARKLVEMGTEGYEEMKDAEGGNSTVVWRPPPLSLSSERYFRQMVDKFSQLQVLVKRQALKEINKLYDSKEDLSAEDAQHLKVLGEMFSQQPWEESDSEDEKRRKRRRVQDMESDSSDEEYFTKLEKEVQKREKERKLKAARRSLDVDSKVVFNKAYHTRRKITAMAMLKPMEKIKRTRSQSRQVPKIMGVLKEECNAADTLMDCQQELNIADEDLDGSSDPEMKEEPEDDDLTADADDVIPENAEDELDKNLPEIEAIEKLVEKIMEEYARTRSTRRKRIERKRPLKKNSNQKMGQQQRMKTMILRRLGLYERMKELQQAKVKSNSSNPKAGPSIDRTYKPHMRKTSLNSITDRTRTTRSKGGVDDDTSEKSQTEPADIKEMQTNPCEKSAGSAEGVNKSNDLQRPTEDVVEDMAIDDQVDDVNDDISECQTDKALELINGNAQKVISGSSQIAENIVPDSDLNSKVPQSIEESKTVADPEQLDITQTVEKECQNEVHQLKASDTTVKESKESQKIVNESITSQNNVNELNVSQIRICNPNTSKNESEDHEMDEEINKQHTAEEGCQANFEDSDDDDVTPQEKSTRSTEPLVEEVPKRRPGRQKGTKLKCYTPKESARKSSRHPVIPPTSDSKEAKKDGQDPAVKRPSYQFSQSRIRAMIPGRFDKLVAQIPDVPIMSEAIPEPKTKTRKQRTRKPKQNEIVGNFKRKRVSAKMKKMLQSNYEMKCLKQAEKLTSLKEQQEQQELQKLIDNPKVPYLAIPILKEKDDNDEDMIDKTRKNIQEKLLKACMTAETNWGKSKYKGGKKQSYFFKPKGGQPRSKDTRLDKKRSNRNTSNMKITKRLVKNISILKSVNSKLSNQGETAQSKTWTSTNSTFPELNADGQEDFQQIEQPKTLSEYEPLLIDQPKTHLQNEPSQSDQPKTHLQNEPSQGDQPKTHLQNEPSQGDQPKTPNKIKKKKETLKKQKAIPVAYKGASAMGKE